LRLRWHVNLHDPIVGGFQITNPGEADIPLYWMNVLMATSNVASSAAFWLIISNWRVGVMSINEDMYVYRSNMSNLKALKRYR
jgi:hypothetical protein